MDNHFHGTSYSAQVQLRLECNGQTIQLSQVAPDWVIPVEPCNLPPSEAEIVTEVDGQEHRRSVFLSDGMLPTSVHVAIRSHVTTA